MKKIIWSSKSIVSLERLILFIDKKWSKQVADNLLNIIDSEIKRIAQNPFLYPIYSKKKNLRKCVIKNKTVLFYRETLNEIEIILFADARQNPGKFKI